VFDSFDVDSSGHLEPVSSSFGVKLSCVAGKAVVIDRMCNV
jgi:hypothetical protein